MTLPHLQSFSILLVAALVGCSGSQTKQAGEENNFSEIPMIPSTAGASSPSSSKPSSSEGSLTEDQKAQMEIALRRGGEKAANCASVVPDAPRGEGEIKVSFDGTKGRCVDVTVGAPWAGTPAEACIKRAFIGEIIVPFDGDLDVPYTVKLGPKAGEEAKSKDAKDAKGKDAKGKDAKVPDKKK